MKKIIFFAVVAIVLFILWRWYKYAQCKALQGQPCSASVMQSFIRTSGGYVPIVLPVPGQKTTSCSFWSGAICK